MAKSQETFNKKEKEKKRAKKAKEKRERKEQRKLEKAEAGKKSWEDMIMYADEFGNLTKTPPDPANKVKVKAENIQISVAKSDKVPFDPVKRGQVKFFNDEKGYGFIVDSMTQDSIFVHANNVEAEDSLRENDKVTYEVEMGPKGPTAVRVRFAPKEVKVEKKEEVKVENKGAEEAENKEAEKVDSKGAEKVENKEKEKGDD